MEAKVLTFSPQEERIQKGRYTRPSLEISRLRVSKMLKGFRDKPPRISIERALYFTESFRQTEHLPLVLRWAKALEHTMKHISVAIDDDDLIVGRCGPLGSAHPEMGNRLIR